MPDDFRNNLILGKLSAEDLTLLEPDLEPLELPLRYRLARVGKPIESVFFLDEGIASVTTHVEHDVAVEIGLIGREGVANISLLLGNDQATDDTYMQVAGKGRRIAAGKFITATKQSLALSAVLLRYVHVLMVQTTATALANGRATVTERLARWLLMARDRVDDDRVPLTHEFLATMLGVRRSGVTAALGDLERRGYVAGARGALTILDREALEVQANGYYGVPEKGWQRMFGGTAADQG